MPRSKSKLGSFEKAVNGQVSAFGMTQREALDRIQAQYADFKKRNEQLLEKHNDSVNLNSSSLVAHTTLLATLTLTVAGFLVNNFDAQLAVRLKVLIIVTVIAEIISALMGLLIYLDSIEFFKKWSRAYANIDAEVDKKINDGSVQFISDLRKIEAKHIRNVPRESSALLHRIMVVTCVLGLMMLVTLYIGYFFDVPLIK